MQKLLKRYLLVVKYYPVTAIVLIATLVSLLILWLNPPADKSALSVICVATIMLSIITLAVDTSFNWNLFKTGTLTKTSVLDIITTLKEIDGRLPIRSVYTNRPRKPFVNTFFPPMAIKQRWIMKWMGVDPDQVTILDNENTAEGVAGSANIADNVIRISSRIKKRHPASYMTTLVHETAHLLEAKAGIHSSIPAFEEDFTDMFCVFMGLGDIMLNGCVSTWRHSEYNMESEEYQQVGYLPPLHLAMAEILTTEMSRPYGEVRHGYSMRSYSLLIRAKLWLFDHGIGFRNGENLSATEYLGFIESQVNGMS